MAKGRIRKTDSDLTIVRKIVQSELITSTTDRSSSFVNHYVSSPGLGSTLPDVTTGSVTSVGLSLPGIFTVTNSPITSSGTLTATLNSQTANTVFASPDGTAGTPTFRALVISDTTGLQTALNGKEPTIIAGTTAQYWRGDKTWQTLNTTAVAEGTNLYFTEVRVRASVLTGYSAGANTALAATDSILTAFGKVQGQITARSTRADTINSVVASDTRAVNEAPQDRSAGIYFDFKQNTTTGLSDTGTYHGMVTFRPYASGTDFSGGPSHRLAFSNSGRLYRQNSTNATTWSSWVRILDTATITASDIPSGSTSYIQNQSASAQSATFNVANDVTVNSMTIGRGGGNISGNTAFGVGAILATATGGLNSAFGMGALQSQTSGNSNTGIGYAAGNLITTTSQNTAIGARSMEFSTGVSNNTGVGFATLRYVVGSNNVAIGKSAYPGIIGGTSTGTDNFAIGNDNLTSNTTGSQNTCIGNSSMYFNTTGNQNIAIGQFTLYNSTTKSANVAIGHEALRYVDIDFQVAIGTAALRGSTTVANNTGTNNSAIGYFALSANTSGSSNTAIGRSSMSVNTTGSDNTAVGYQAGNTNTTGSDNTYIGLDAKGLATGNWQIGIGSGVQPTASNLGAWGGNTNATRTDLGIGIFTPTARLHIATLAVGNKGLIIDGIASQTANLVEVNATTGGTNYVTVNSGGAVNMTRRATTGIATLTDGATISLDASLGNHFRVTLGGNRTLAAPTNPTDGQRIMIEVIQDGTGGRTLTLTTGTNGFAFGTDITGITLSTAINARDFIGAVYNSTAQRWYVIAFVKGY